LAGTLKTNRVQINLEDRAINDVYSINCRDE